MCLCDRDDNNGRTLIADNPDFTGDLTNLAASFLRVILFFFLQEKAGKQLDAVVVFTALARVKECFQRGLCVNMGALYFLPISARKLFQSPGNAVFEILRFEFSPPQSL